VLLSFNHLLHVRNAPLYVVDLDASEDSELSGRDSDDFVQLDGQIDAFLEQFYLVRSTLDLPAAVTNNIYLGALRHGTSEIIKCLNIKLVISGLSVTSEILGKRCHLNFICNFIVGR
jgi:hypothetical protein